jgi:hypothetical protein
MLAGLFVITKTRAGHLYAAEAYVVLLFCVGWIFSASTSPWRRRKKGSLGNLGRLGPSDVGALVRLALGLVTCGYGIWFAFHGLDSMLHPACSRSAFFFGRVRVFGWFRSFLKCVFVGGLVMASALLLNATTSVIIDGYGWVKNWTDTLDEESVEEGKTKSPSLLVALTSLIALSVFVVAVELTLYWNRVQGVWVWVYRATISSYCGNSWSSEIGI